MNVEELKIGSLVSYTFDSAHGKPLHRASWSKPAKVIKIITRGISIKGIKYAHFSLALSDKSSISMSVNETDEWVRIINT